MGNHSVDDMESCLHSPTYARSCEMYTHVGTVPRNDKQKKSFKGLKEKKTKTEEEEEEEKGMSERQGNLKAGEHVRDSPLLGALTSLSVNNMEKPQPASALARSLPVTPTSSRTSPLTSESDSCDPAVEPLTSSEALKRKNDLETAREPSVKSHKATSNQDLYVPMDPIAETAHSHLDPQTERLRGVTRTQETTTTVKSSQEVEYADKWDVYLFFSQKMHVRNTQPDCYSGSQFISVEKRFYLET